MNRATLETYWVEVRGSYWFIPSVMTVGAIILSFIATSIDGFMGSSWIDDVSWLYANKPDGARALLSTIAGSMITVAGVTFSITIAAVAYATSQFGPRLLTNFMQDRGNQVTLGTFIATYIYCLLVLRTIRSAEELPPGASLPLDEPLAEAFVPHVAILGGLILALASVGVLIYFIHHVPESIHASNVVAHIGRELNEKIDQLFPEMIGYAPPDQEDYDVEEDVPANFLEEARPVQASGCGYISYIDERQLLRAATHHDLLIRLEYRPGNFVTPKRILVFAWPAAHVDEKVEDMINDAFAWSNKRTQTQDVMFLVDEPVEIAARALSTGVNDPFTAMNCMDWLGSALSRLAERGLPPTHRYDEENNLRLIACPITFDMFAEAVFTQLRPYVKSDVNAALHMMKTIAEVIGDVGRDAHRETLLAHATALRRSCQEVLDQQEVELIDARHRVVVQLANKPALYRRLMNQYEWLSGSA